MITSMDEDGIDIMVIVIEEEKNLYPIFDYGQIQKAINLQKEKLHFNRRNNNI